MCRGCLKSCWNKVVFIALIIILGYLFYLNPPWFQRLVFNLKSMF